MHPKLEEFIAEQNKISRPQARFMASVMDNSIPPNANILAIHKGTRTLTVLTDKSVFWSNGGQVKSVQLKSITAINQKGTKATLGTSTEKIQIGPGVNGLGMANYKKLPPFIKAIRQAMEEI